MSAAEDLDKLRATKVFLRGGRLRVGKSPQEAGGTFFCGPLLAYLYEVGRSWSFRLS